MTTSLTSYFLPLQARRSYSKLTFFAGTYTVIYNYLGVSLDSCAIACDNMKCVGYAYDSTQSSNCLVLKEITMATFQNTLSPITVYAYFKLNYIRVRNAEVLGTNIVTDFSNISFDQCGAMCTSMLGCIGYVTQNDLGSGCIFSSGLTSKISSSITR